MLRQGHWVVIHRHGKYDTRRVKLVTEKQIRLSDFKFGTREPHDSHYTIVTEVDIVAVFENQNEARDACHAGNEVFESFKSRVHEAREALRLILYEQIDCADATVEALGEICVTHSGT